MTFAVDVRGLGKNYGKNRVLDGITLQLEPGRFHALIGRNGAGKSTLLRVLMRHEAVEEGGGSVLGVSLAEDSAVLNASVGYVTESIDYNLPFCLREVFAEYARGFPGWDEALFRGCARELGLDLEKRFAELSRGLRMQVCLAAAFAIRPRLLLLDEITSVLDARARGYFMELAGGLVRSGGTVVLATNIVSEVNHYLDRLILLEGGRVRLSLPAGEIAASFRKLRRPAGAAHPIFTDPAYLEIGIGEDGSTTGLLPADAALRYSPPEALVHPGKANAEDVFIYYTREGCTRERSAPEGRD